MKRIESLKLSGAQRLIIQNNMEILEKKQIERSN